MVAAGFGVAGPSDMGVSSLMKLDGHVPVMALAFMVLPPKEPTDVRLCRGLWHTVELGDRRVYPSVNGLKRQTPSVPLSL